MLKDATKNISSKTLCLSRDEIMADLIEMITVDNPRLSEDSELDERFLTLTALRLLIKELQTSQDRVLKTCSDENGELTKIIKRVDLKPLLPHVEEMQREIYNDIKHSTYLKERIEGKNVSFPELQEEAVI